MRQITAAATIAVLLMGCSAMSDSTAPDSSPPAAGAASEDGLEQVADAAETFVTDLERWPHLGVYGDCVSNAEDWVIAIGAAIVGEGPDPTTDLYATFGTDDPRPDIYIDVGLQVAEVYASGSGPAPGSGHNLVKQACADAIEDGLYGPEAASSLADLVDAGHPRTAQAGEIGTPTDRSAEPDPAQPPESDGSAEPRVVEAQAAWLELTAAACDEEMLYADPADAQMLPQEDGSVLVVDDNGTTLRLTSDLQRVEPVDGPDGLMPDPYTWCDSQVFVGTMDH